MTNMTPMIDAFIGQLANPECSYLTGMMIGAIGVMRIIIVYFMILIVYKFVDRLAIEPFLSMLKKKIYKRKEKK